MPGTRQIERLSWDEVAAALTADRLIVLPIGAFAKEHGLHLPMNTDAVVAARLALAVADRLDALVAPVVGHGHYPAFTRYAGSQSLARETFVALLDELMQGLFDQGARRLLLLNTGVSTEGATGDAVARFEARTCMQPIVAHLRLLGCNAGIEWQQSGGGHADERETSLMLAIAPELVRMERARSAETDPQSARRPVLSPYPDDAAEHSSTGATGDPTKADAEKGRTLLDAIIDDIAALAANGR